MANTTILSALTKGLVAGYGGKSSFQKIQRAGFSMESSDYQENGILYHDEWLNARNGGGQELVTDGDQSFTRLYGGGIPSPSILSSIDISEDEIIGFLRRVIAENPGLTRLQEPFSFQEDDWLYEYKILDIDSDLEVTIGKETISYRNSVVFVHGFLLTPIRT